MKRVLEKESYYSTVTDINARLLFLSFTLYNFGENVIYEYDVAQ